MRVFTKPDHLSSKFLNGLSEQAKGRSAWFFAFWALLFFQFTVISKLSSSIESSEKILIPYNVAVNKGEIKFSTDYSVGTDYIKLIAEADAFLWGNTRPDNATAIKHKFLNRFHPKLYSEAKEDILREANADRLREVTRSFDTIKTYSDKEGRIRIDGITAIDIAGIQGPAKKISLLISYMKGAGGYPYIVGWENVNTKGLDL
jgi:hypothetical protein